MRRQITSALVMGLFALAATPARVQSGPYDPQVGAGAQDAIAKTSPLFQEWASSVLSITRGPQDITDPNSPLVSFGSPSNALGSGSGNATNGLVSLGDGGSIILGFSSPIVNGAGADFAVFENGFGSGGSGLAYLELATVSVSSDGVHFFEFPAVSLTQTQTQVGGFGLLDASYLYDLAGKYTAGYGTPFDLSELVGVSPLLNVNNITQVKITDVVGSIDPLYGTRDSLGNLINGPVQDAVQLRRLRPQRGRRAPRGRGPSRRASPSSWAVWSGWPWSVEDGGPDPNRWPPRPSQGPRRRARGSRLHWEIRSIMEK